MISPLSDIFYLKAVYTLEEWIATDSLIIWELRTLVTTEKSSKFVGVSRCISSDNERINI